VFIDVLCHFGQLHDDPAYNTGIVRLASAISTKLGDSRKQELRSELQYLLTSTSIVNIPHHGLEKL